MSIWNDMSWVPALRTPFLNLFFESITLMGYPLFLILFLCFGYFALGSNRFFHTGLLLIVTGLSNAMLKDFGQDPRPDPSFALDPRIGTSYGWPSGHMQIAVVLWGYLAYRLRQNWIYAAAALFIALQGFSRIYLGVHDVGDVVAGFVFGLICLFGYIWVETHPRLSAGISRLTVAQSASILLAVHIIYIALYPAHAGHMPAYWFIGMMMGWVLGWQMRARQAVSLPGAWPVHLTLAALLTGICFYMMIFTTRLTGRLTESLGLDAVWLNAAGNYGFGIVFAVFTLWALPALVARLVKTP